MTVINSNGNKSTRKAWINGINEAELVEVMLKQGDNKGYYFETTFTRQAETIRGRREYFAPLTDYIFYPSEKLYEFCRAFGHELKPRPSDMAIEVYLKHVLARLNTFVHRKIKLAVKAYKDVLRGEYGEAETRITYQGDIEEVSVVRMDIISYGEKLNWLLWIDTGE